MKKSLKRDAGFQHLLVQILKHPLQFPRHLFPWGTLRAELRLLSLKVLNSLNHWIGIRLLYRVLYRVPYSDGNIRLKILVHQRNEDLSQYFFEDDEVQKNEIEKGWNGKVIHVSHDFTEKENVRHLEDLDE